MAPVSKTVGFYTTAVKDSIAGCHEDKVANCPQLEELSDKIKALIKQRIKAWMNDTHKNLTPPSVFKIANDGVNIFSAISPKNKTSHKQPQSVKKEMFWLKVMLHPIYIHTCLRVGC